MGICTTTRRASRTLPAVAGVCLLAALACAAPPPPAVNPGDTTAEVIDKLGKPQGTMSRGRLTTYYYERGLVYFDEGRVQSATLLTPEEAQRQRRERELAERLQRERIALQQQALAEGQAELAARRADAEFLASPAADRLAYWTDFRKRHPDIDVSADIAGARAAGRVGSDDQPSEELRALRARVESIRARLAQLDADYAVSRTTWKRNEITAERTKLLAELESALNRGATPGEGESKSDGKGEP